MNVWSYENRSGEERDPNHSDTADVALVRSILEKPLSQLTEDDISQLTREDRRNYLKQKGMRRPSWNKSQAIQQVISLKALLEPNDDSAAALLRKIVGSPPPHPPEAASDSTETAKDVQGVKSAVEPVLPQKKEPQKPVWQDERTIKAVNPSKNQCTTDASIRQMTIFYSGKVNVYDEMPPDKARTIMHLAARPNHKRLDNQYGGTAAVRSLHCQFQNAGKKYSPFLANATIPQAIRAEGQANRKVSLQRLREKRRDREQVKIRKSMGPTSTLEIYLNQELRRHPSNEDSSRSSAGSPPQLSGLLQVAKNQIHCLPIDLNENEILDAEQY